ncbi:MAG: VPDSG-CTERM sorting domain-containing protein [Opitutaceae bacterium]|nr:VPDSG-CTERM sorting domain-containing protein [Opitutaceae bacterium]
MSASKLFSAAALALGLTGSAFGLTFTAASVAAASGNSNDPSSASQVKTALGLSYDLTELYRATQSGDSGTFDDSYRTTFSSSNTDVSVDNVGSPVISGYNSLFLLAWGDNDADPDWKIFNITGWNGTDNIFLDRIFPKAGDPNKWDMELVKIFGGNAPQGPNNGVPDSGSTAVLLGSVLLGLALYSRRK